MDVRLEQLPNDLNTCHQLIAELLDSLGSKQRQIDQLPPQQAPGRGNLTTAAHRAQPGCQAVDRRAHASEITRPADGPHPHRLSPIAYRFSPISSPRADPSSGALIDLRFSRDR